MSPLPTPSSMTPCQRDTFTNDFGKDYLIQLVEQRHACHGLPNELHNLLQHQQLVWWIKDNSHPIWICRRQVAMCSWLVLHAMMCLAKFPLVCMNFLVQYKCVTYKVHFCFFIIRWFDIKINIQTSSSS